MTLAACGDDPKGPKTAELDTIGTPMLVAVRHGAGDWQTVAVAGSRYSIPVEEPYIVAVACNDVAGLFDSYQFARTPDDEPEIEAPCTGEGPALTGKAQGTLAQLGEVAVGFSRALIDEPGGAYTIDAAPGAQELVASDSTHVAVKRLQIAGATAVPAIDLVRDGQPLDVADLSITNAGGDRPQVSSRMFTEHGTFFIGFSPEPDQVQLVPDTLLVAADDQRVSVSAAGASDTVRSLSRRNVRGATDLTFALPEPLVGASLAENVGTIEATFAALPEHDSLSLTIDQTGSNSTLWFHDMDISAAYAAAMGTTIALDLDIPGFDPDWRLDLSAEYNRSLAARKQRTADDTASSTLRQTVNLAPGKPQRAARKVTPPKRALALR